MHLKNLIVIATTISYTACAATPKHIEIVEPMQVVTEAPPISDEWPGVHEIDPKHPPLDGVWMDWDDAYAMAIYTRKQRVNYEIALINANKDKEIFRSQLNTANRQIKDLASPAKSWWFTWGFPVGLGLGLILGLVVPLTIQGQQK